MDERDHEGARPAAPDSEPSAGPEASPPPLHDLPPEAAPYLPDWMVLDAPPAMPPPTEPYAPPLREWIKRSFFDAPRAWLRDRFLGADPTFLSAFAPFAIIAVVLFSRVPWTNYIFDEQEALLANPYVNATGGLRYRDAIHRDFWGLLPDRSIGSYRPIPDLLWRGLWSLSSKSDGIFRQPFVHHIYNVFFHAINAAILSCIVFAWTKRRGQAYVAGLVFVACAVLTEAVSGIVGIADVLGGMGALLAVAALSLPGWAMPFAVFTAVSFGLFCKESALVCVPLVPFAALLVSPLTHPERPARFLRAAMAFVAAAAAFYLYVELRKKWFPSPLPADLMDDPDETAPSTTRWLHEFLVWFHQAPLPKDPLNNPLAQADKPYRIAGAMRVYVRGLVQLVFPSPLSGDYSFPQEPVPEKLIFPESVAGAAMMALPLLGSLLLWPVAMWRERRARREAPPDSVPLREQIAGVRNERRVFGLVLLLVALLYVGLDFMILRECDIIADLHGLPLWVAAVPVGLLALGLVVEGLPALPRPDPRRLGFSGVILVAVGLTWVVVSYFPHSNIPIVLPTVRAERFWYFPAIGSTLVIAVFVSWFHEIGKKLRVRWLVPALFSLFIVFQGVQAYRHAMDYRSDVDFWRATKDAVPNSAKAHLNYSVMKGARGDLQTRLVESRIAMRLAPDWAMAHIYTGDTLCRLHRADEAWPHYKEGFEKGKNDLSLIALALQCLYDEKALLEHEEELRALATEYEGSWIAYLATDTLSNHEKNKGVDPKYRPRGYNEGPKE